MPGKDNPFLYRKSQKAHVGITFFFEDKICRNKLKTNVFIMNLLQDYRENGNVGIDLAVQKRFMSE